MGLLPRVVHSPRDALGTCRPAWPELLSSRLYANVVASISRHAGGFDGSVVDCLRLGTGSPGVGSRFLGHHKESLQQVSLTLAASGGVWRLAGVVCCQMVGALWTCCAGDRCECTKASLARLRRVGLIRQPAAEECRRPCVPTPFSSVGDSFVAGLFNERRTDVCAIRGLACSSARSRHRAAHVASFGESSGRARIAAS